MNIRYVCLYLLTAFVFVFGSGCRKSESTGSSASSAPLPLSKDTVARVHWVGKRRLGVEAGAYYVMRIWSLSASEQLEKQTLGKLSTAPSFLATQPSTLDPQLSALLLRPLLNDALQEECHFEIRQTTNQSFETVFAIRLNESRDGFWETNLAIAVQSLTGVPALSTPGHGWSVKRRDSPNLIEVIRAGDWTLLGVAQNHNTLLEDAASRAQRFSNPFSFRPGTNYWLEADADPQRLASALSLDCRFPTNSPRISFAITGDGGNVLTDGEFVFPQPLQIGSDRWNISTNLIREPLTSFTAIRTEPWLASSKTWNDFSAFLESSNPPPNQLCFWSQSGGPFETYFSAPVTDAGNRVHQLAERLMAKANPWLDSHNYVSFQPLPDSNGVTWGNLSMVKPFLTSAGTGNQSVVLGGLLSNPASPTNPPVRSALLRDLSESTNLLYFDWEITGQRVEPWLYIGQVTRTLLHRPQLPMDSVGSTWLATMRTRLGDSTTKITQTGPNQLSFTRKSTIGLTAPELHLLVDWLESPQFPKGL